MLIKKNLKPAICAICAILVLAAIGLGFMLASSGRQSSDGISPYPTVSVLPNGLELYQQAVNASENYTFTVSSVTKTRTGNQTFTEASLQTVHIDNTRMHISETHTIGGYTIESSLTYADGLGYHTLGDARFYSEMTETEFRSRYAPLAMFEDANYRSCQAIYNGNTTTVYFSQATTAEQWAVSHYDTLREASGYAVLDADNQLIASSYSIQYRLGNVLIEKTIEVHATQTESAIEIPNTDAYLPLEDPDALIALERACGFLLQAESVSSQIADTIICEAFGDHRTQETELKMNGSGDTFRAEIDISATSVNSSRGGETTNKNQVITYQDKLYTIVENNGAPVAKEDTDPASIRLYCQNSLVGTILLPEYITSVTVTEEDNLRLYSFTANEALSQLMSQSVCQILYQNPDLLNTMASAHTTNTMEGYLAVDALTGLPISSGVRYSSFYTIDDFPYPLQYVSEQTYIIP